MLKFKSECYISQYSPGISCPGLCFCLTKRIITELLETMPCLIMQKKCDDSVYDFIKKKQAEEKAWKEK